MITPSKNAPIHIEKLSQEYLEGDTGKPHLSMVEKPKYKISYKKRKLSNENNGEHT